MIGFMRTLKTSIGLMALVLALTFAIGMQSASAQTISTSSSGWTPENFASSCKAAGGRLIEIDQGDIKYSKCVFQDGTNKCDWIKKVCTFGIVAGPFSTKLDTISTGTLTTSTSGGGSGGSGGTMTAAPNDTKSR